MTSPPAAEGKRQDKARMQGKATPHNTGPVVPMSILKQKLSPRASPRGDASPDRPGHPAELAVLRPRKSSSAAGALAAAEAELDAAARRVQAIQRGRATRTEARQQHQAATMLQARHRGRCARSTRWRTQTQHVLASPVGGDYEQEDFEEEAYGSDFDLEEEMAEAALLSHRSGLSAGEARVQSRCCFGKKVPIIVANLVF